MLETGAKITKNQEQTNPIAGDRHSAAAPAPSSAASASA